VPSSGYVISETHVQLYYTFEVVLLLHFIHQA